MKMRAIFSIIGIMAMFLAVSGQTAEERAILLKQEGVLSVEGSHRMDQKENAASGDPATIGENGGDPARLKGKLGLSVGTAFSYSRGYGSGMMFYAAPTYTLPLNDRWALHGGVIATYHQGLNLYNPVENYFSGQFSSLALFAAASYRMNDRLVLHGSGVKQLVSAPNAPFSPYSMDHFSVGATYRLGDNITIGATLHMNTGGQYAGSPYNGFGAMPPFSW
jgi:hypothetical protein